MNSKTYALVALLLLAAAAAGAQTTGDYPDNCQHISTVVFRYGLFNEPYFTWTGVNPAPIAAFAPPQATELRFDSASPSKKWRLGTVQQMEHVDYPDLSTCNFLTIKNRTVKIAGDEVRIEALTLDSGANLLVETKRLHIYGRLLLKNGSKLVILENNDQYNQQPVVPISGNSLIQVYGNSEMRYYSAFDLVYPSVSLAENTNRVITKSAKIVVGLTASVTNSPNPLPDDPSGNACVIDKSRFLMVARAMYITTGHNLIIHRRNAARIDLMTPGDFVVNAGWTNTGIAFHQDHIQPEADPTPGDCTLTPADLEQLGMPAFVTAAGRYNFNGVVGGKFTISIGAKVPLDPVSIGAGYEQEIPAGSFFAPFLWALRQRVYGGGIKYIARWTNTGVMCTNYHLNNRYLDGGDMHYDGSCLPGSPAPAPCKTGNGITDGRKSNAASMLPSTAAPKATVSPNPFSKETVIHFNGHVKGYVTIFNAMGAPVYRAYVNATSFRWAGSDNQGRLLPGGVYYISYGTGGRTAGLFKAVIAR